MAQSVVSLRRSMDDWDRQQAVLAVVVAAFRDTVTDVSHQVVAPLDETGGQRALALSDAARAIDGTNHELLSAARRRVREDLTEFGSRIRELAGGQQELNEVLTLLEHATENLTARERDNQQGVRRMAQELEDTVRLETIDAVRDRIRSHVRALIAHADRMASTFEASFKQLQNQVDGYRSRLAKAENEAQTDALTGLANRRAFEQRLEQLIAEGETFTLVIADLNRFKLINDVHGHLVGDEVLKIFAARLRGALRQGDLAARWGGDEFVVILRCGMSDALARHRQMEARLSGPYSVRREEGAALRLQVSASIGFAERKEGESAAQLVCRADQMLYGQKTA